MRDEYLALGVDEATEDEVRTFLRRMNANYRIDSGPDPGRQLLRQVGGQLGHLGTVDP